MLDCNTPSLIGMFLLTAVACAHQTQAAEQSEDDPLSLGGKAAISKGGSGSRAGQPGILPPAGTAGKSSSGAGGKAGSGAGGSAGASRGGAEAGGSGGSGVVVNMPIPGISMRFKSDDPNTAAPVSAIQGEIHIVNTSGQPLQLNELTVRYYLSNEVTVATNFETRWGQLRSASSMNFTFTGTMVPFPEGGSLADSYIEFSFNEPHSVDMGKTAVASWQIRDPNGQQKFNQDNDYSFSATATDSEKLVLLQNGVVIWGVEP